LGKASAEECGDWEEEKHDRHVATRPNLHVEDDGDDDEEYVEDEYEEDDEDKEDKLSRHEATGPNMCSAPVTFLY